MTMPLSAEDLTRLEALIATAAPGGDLQRAFRGEFPGVTLTQVDAGDMDTQVPFREHPQWLLYLVDGSHCRQVTSEPERATGIVLARRCRGARP